MQSPWSSSSLHRTCPAHRSPTLRSDITTEKPEKMVQYKINKMQWKTQAPKIVKSNLRNRTRATGYGQDQWLQKDRRQSALAFRFSRNIPLTDLEITFLGKYDGKKGGRVMEQARREVKKNEIQIIAWANGGGEKERRAIFSYAVLLFYTQVWFCIGLEQYSP